MSWSLIVVHSFTFSFETSFNPYLYSDYGTELGHYIEYIVNADSDKLTQYMK